MSTSTQPSTVASGRRRWHVNGYDVFLLGVIVIPFVLSATLNSYGPLTEEGAIRMAFATISGQTVAILSGVLIVVITTIRRPNLLQLVRALIVAVAVIWIALAIMHDAGSLLLERLDLIATTTLLNK